MKPWRVSQQYIVDGNGDVVCQWGSYTSRRRANLIASIPAMLTELKELRANLAAMSANNRLVDGTLMDSSGATDHK